MRVILDANIFISYLLKPSGRGDVAQIMAALRSGAFDVLVPEELLKEVIDSCAKKRLSRTIRAEEVEVLITLLRQMGEQLSALSPPFAAYTRDFKDDYLIAYALVAHADYLVSGDKDLLVLWQVESVQILSPAAFSALLRQAQAT